MVAQRTLIYQILALPSAREVPSSPWEHLPPFSLAQDDVYPFTAPLALGLRILKGPL